MGGGRRQRGHGDQFPDLQQGLLFSWMWHYGVKKCSNAIWHIRKDYIFLDIRFFPSEVSTIIFLEMSYPVELYCSEVCTLSMECHKCLYRVART